MPRALWSSGIKPFPLYGRWWVRASVQALLSLCSSVVYEETTGLMVNDLVLRTRKPLSVELGPGILGNIFDGIKRPLKTIPIKSGDVYIPRGVSFPALDKDILWEFQPKKIGEGDLLTGGDLYATVNENSLMQHHVALPPDAMGKITYIAPAGQYSLKTWPLRTPRPVAAKLAADTPLLTRQTLESFHEKFDPDFINTRTKAREVLQRGDDLNEIVQIGDAIMVYLLIRNALIFVPLSQKKLHQVAGFPITDCDGRSYKNRTSQDCDGQHCCRTNQRHTKVCPKV
nr:V-type proton ATPase catalytic subunit A [Ipomoea batatas]